MSGSDEALNSEGLFSWDITSFIWIALIFLILSVLTILIFVYLYSRSRNNQRNTRGLFLVKGLTEKQNNLLQDFIDSRRHNLGFYGQVLHSVPAELLDRESWRMINLGSNLLHNLPPEEDLWKNQALSLTELLLSHNYLSQLPPSLAILSSLTGITIMQNRFREFPSVLHRLERLTTLDLSYNFIDFATEGESFKLPAPLETVKLNNNLITRFPDNFFESSQTLVRLFLHSNSLISLPKTLSSCERLRLLNLANNNCLFSHNGEDDYDIIEKPTLIDPQTNVNNHNHNSNSNSLTSSSNVVRSRATSAVDERRTRLHWPSKLIQKTTSPDESRYLQPSASVEILSLCKNLTRLNISNTGLSVLPLAFFENLVHLEDLLASNNFLKEIPSDISRLKSLRLLELNTNAIEKIAAEIWLLERLDYLFLSSNQISQFPDPPNIDRAVYGTAYLFLPHLQELHLADNLIESVPSSFISAPRLRKLNICLNPHLKKIPADIGSASHLETILASGCPLLRSDQKSCERALSEELEDNVEGGEIPWKGLAQLKRLRELFFGHCQVECVPQSFLSEKIPDLASIEYGNGHCIQLKTISMAHLSSPSSLLHIPPHELSNNHSSSEGPTKLGFGEAHMQGKRRTMEDATSRRTIRLEIEPFVEEEKHHEEITTPYDFSQIAHEPDVEDDLVHDEFHYDQCQEEDHINNRNDLGDDGERDTTSNRGDNLSFEDKIKQKESHTQISPVVEYVGLFDGHGGSSVANYCAARLWRLVSSHLEQEFRENPRATLWYFSSIRRTVVRRALQKSFQAVQAHIEKANELHEGTTAVVVLLFTCSQASCSGSNTPTSSPNGQSHRVPGELFVGNVGDSRAVLYTRVGQNIVTNSNPGGTPNMLSLRRMTSDHRPEEACVADPQDAGLVNFADEQSGSNGNEKLGSGSNDLSEPRKEWERVVRGGGFVSEDGRVQGQLAVSRGVGDLDLQPHVYPTPSFSSATVSFSPEDNNEQKYLLVVACDGVWDVMEDVQAFGILHGCLAKEGKMILRDEKCCEAASRIRDLAYSYHSTDNISSVVLSF